LNRAGSDDAEILVRRRWLRPACVLLGFVVLGALSLPRVAEGQAPQSAPVLAVLPFQINSANDLDYLGDSVANLIRSRLEAGGQVGVLDAAKVSRTVSADAAAGASEAQLREFAGALGAGFVVTGSITELAGSFSLDVRVTPAAAAQPGRTMVVTADREDELLALVNDVADRVLAAVVGAAPSRVAIVEITGADHIEAELRSRLETRAGDPYDPVKVRDDVAALRSDPDIANVTAETKRSPDGVIVRFAVVTAERILSEVPAGARSKRVDDVVIRGNQRIESDAIKTRIGTTPGGPYRTSQVAKDVQAIYTLGFFRNVQVLTEASPRGGIIVIFEVEENPVDDRSRSPGTTMSTASRFATSSP
jgi:outer membrane protein insertion porin family